MNPIATQQASLDNALVPHRKRLKIERCNARIAFSKPQREETYQVTLEALKLSPCYPAFVITAKLPQIYMHQFWNTITKIRDTDAYKFKLDKKKCRVDTEVFREILHICPIILNQYFIIQKKIWLHSFRNLAILADVICYLQLTLIKCTSLGERLLQSSIDFMYQADNKEISSASKEHMPYPRFTKVIINHFISTDKTISMRNRISLHIIRDDLLLGTLKFVSKTQDYQQKVPLRKARKYKKVASPLRKLSPVKETEPVKKTKRIKRPAKKCTTAPTTGVAIRDTPGVSVSKKKTHAKADRSKGNGVSSQPKVPDESEDKTTGTDEGTSTKPGVPDVPKYQSKSKNESWSDSIDDNDYDNDDDSKSDDDKANSDDDGNSDTDDNERTDSDDDDDDDENPSFTLKDDDEEEHDEEYESDDDYEIFVEDAHVTLTSSHKTESSIQSSFVSSDFASKFLILENVPPAVDEVASMMKSHQEESSTQATSLFTVPVTAIPETATAHATIVPPTISMITPLLQLTTPSPAPTTISTTTLIHTLPDFSSLFGSDQRVSTLETDFSRIVYATRTALESYTKELEKKVQEKRKLYIDVVEKSVKDIIKDEVKSLLPHILPKEVSDFATHVIQSTITESLENVVLAKSSSQPQSTYVAATSLTEFELKKILLDKLEKSKSYRAAKVHKNIYDALIQSYQLDNDLFDSYGKAYSLKRSHEDKDKDEDPLAGPDQGLKKRKKSKDVEPPRSSKSKDSQSSSFKGTKSQSKSSGKSAQVEELEASKYDWFKKPERPLTPDPDWNTRKQIDFKPPQMWISQIAKAEKPPLTFDELMSTPIDFLAFVMNHLKIDNLTQQHLVGSTFNLLKGTCKSQVELEYHFEECYKAVTNRLDWTNPEGHKSPFDLSKPLPLIELQGHQVVPAGYFINNDLEYLKGGSLSRK
ncbi:hypothetical protein Tco_0726278 [Tanacetum coccineum]|uniref:F-box domain-containing protein n=1 Tax=Tanacetum coccineum TaxID=301880 RepID=A0ABQ4YG06_9ASTR